MNLAVRRRTFGQEGLVVSISVCFFYIAGHQRDRVRSEQPVISRREDGSRVLRKVSNYVNPNGVISPDTQVLSNTVGTSNIQCRACI